MTTIPWLVVKIKQVLPYFVGWAGISLTVLGALVTASQQAELLFPALAHSRRWRGAVIMVGGVMAGLGKLVKWGAEIDVVLAPKLVLTDKVTSRTDV